MRRFMVWGGVILSLLVVIGSVIASIVSIGSNTSPTSGTSSNPWFWAVVIALIVIAGIYLFTGRGGWGGTLSVGLVVLLLAIKLFSGIFFGDRAPEVEKAFQRATAESILSGGSGNRTEMRIVTQTTAKWEKTAEDGSLPIGVWSESYMIPPGYRTHYDKGNCVAYKIRQRLYGGEWLTHSCDGTYPAGNEIQFMALRAGLKKIPFSIQQP